MQECGDLSRRRNSLFRRGTGECISRESNHGGGEGKRLPKNVTRKGERWGCTQFKLKKCRRLHGEVFLLKGRGERGKILGTRLGKKGLKEEIWENTSSLYRGDAAYTGTSGLVLRERGDPGIRNKGQKKKK